jgi:hypothetical protein
VNRVVAHLDGEIFLKFTLSENITEFADKQYRTLTLGKDLTVFLRDEQLEQLFFLLDKTLHEETYSMLEDKLFNVTDDLEQANGTVEYYRELEEEGRYK